MLQMLLQFDQVKNKQTLGCIEPEKYNLSGYIVTLRLKLTADLNPLLCTNSCLYVFRLCKARSDCKTDCKVNPGLTSFPLSQPHFVMLQADCRLFVQAPLNSSYSSSCIHCGEVFRYFQQNKCAMLLSCKPTCDVQETEQLLVIIMFLTESNLDVQHFCIPNKHCAKYQHQMFSPCKKVKEITL